MLNLISDRLVKMIEDNRAVIVDRWVERLKADSGTTAFSGADLHRVRIKSLALLADLGSWVGYETTKEDIGRFYAREGMGLFRMGIPLCEGMRALVLLKRTIWLYVMHECCFDSALELYQMRELNDRVLLFFDRAQYYFLRGYMEAMNRRMKELWHLTDADTREIFFDTSFYRDSLP